MILADAYFNEYFLSVMQNIFKFLASCFTGIWTFLTANTWLLSLVIAPLLVALIVFGVSLAINLVQKTDGKGER